MMLDETALMEECDDDKDLLKRMLEIYDRDAAERLPSQGRRQQRAK